MKDKLIWCNTKEKLEKVVQKLKSDEFNVPKTETMWGSYGAELVLSVHTKYKSITYCSRDWYKEHDYATPITADEFLRKNKNPAIVIFRRDRNVIAKNVATGNEGIAKCSPDNEFVFKTGASIAMARLMAKTPEALNHDVKDEWIKVLGLTPVEKRVYTDADRDFKVGDRVVVRDWDDMEKEYGVNKWGDIPKDSQFTDSMKHLCGRTATVTCVANGLGFKKVAVDFDDKSGCTSYTFNPWMFNPIDVLAPENGNPEAKFKVGDYVTLKKGLVGGKKYGALTLYSGRMYEYANGKRLEVETATFNESDGMHHYRCKAADGNYFYYTEPMLDKWDEDKIHEGDTVKVVNAGLNYSSYVQWVGEHISDPYMAARFCFGSPSLDEKYKVIKIAEHERNGRMLAYIEQIGGLSYNKCYLIEVKGLEKA